MRRQRFATLSAVFLIVLTSAIVARGHAILKESRPTANSKVVGPDVPILLRYNVRVDAKLSRVGLLSPDNATTDLKIEAQTSPDTLNAKVSGLRPSNYRIYWQVLAPDGHITRGESPFTVTPL